MKYKWDRSSHTVEKYKQLLVQKGSSLILVHFICLRQQGLGDGSARGSWVLEEHAETPATLHRGAEEGAEPGPSLDPHRTPAASHQHLREYNRSTLYHVNVRCTICFVAENTGSRFSLCFQGCTGCKSPPAVPPAAPFDVEIHDMELCSVLKAEEESAGEVMKSLTEAAHPEGEEEEEGVEDKGTEKQDSSQDMAAEEEGARSDTVEGKSET